MRFFLKAGMLLLILVLPVLIYIFLQAFGKNEYDLPVYFENGVDSVAAGCDYPEGQYKVPADFLGKANNNIIIAFFRPAGIKSTSLISEVARAMNVFQKEDVKLLLFSPENETDFHQLEKELTSFGNKSSQWLLSSNHPEQIKNIAACGFVILEALNENSLDDHFPLVLIDKERRIRGYYNGEDREEIDRLIVEINILLANYRL